MKIVDESGVPLSSSFWVEPFEASTSVLLNSASGGHASAEYQVALRLLLSRLRAMDARVTDAFVDSRHTHALGLPREAARLDLRGNRPYPLRLTAESNIEELQRAFAAAQVPVGQPEGAKGGNRNKRIRLIVEPASDPFPTDLEAFLAGGKGMPPEIRDALNASAVAAGKRTGGQGFIQSAAARQAIERRAMDVAEAELAALGYTSIVDVSLTESYDFRCTLNEHEVHVEVKGTTSHGERVLLTRNEVEHAREWHPFIVLVVVHAIELQTVGGAPTASGGTANVVERWKLLDSALEPISYECVVPIPSS